MHAIVLSIGDELVSGQTLNTNSFWLAQQLAAVGIRTLSHITIGDQLAPIVSAIRQAGEILAAVGEEDHRIWAGKGRPASHGVLLLTGGLGPTEDDLTRKALADALNEQLVEDPDALLQIENWFRARGRVMSPSNRLQALRPSSSTILENTAGTAPGLHATTGHPRHDNMAKHPAGGDAGAGGGQWGGAIDIFVMPGVPREMQEMFTRSVLPLLQQKAAAEHPDPIISQVTKINTFGLGESIAGERIRDLMTRGNEVQAAAEAGPASRLSVGTTVFEGVVSVRIYATGTRQQVDLMTQQVRQRVHERLGPWIFSENEEPLEAAVATLLRQHKHTLATSESCTGGMLATLLTNVPGSSAYFLRGWVTYANAAKHDELAIPEDLLQEHGAVSEPVARAMAEGARRFAATDFALATTGIAGPDGGTPDKPVGTVWIALATPAGTTARRFNLPGNRQAIRQRTCQWALALLRWHLLGIPAPS
jgi:nicotinamide-nucleotide amidase